MKIVNKLKKWVRRKGEPRSLKLGDITNYRGIPVKIIGIVKRNDGKVYHFRNLTAKKWEDAFFAVKFKKKD